MSATKVFGAAIALGVIGRWASNKKALPSIGGSLEVLGALFLVSVMDRGKSEPVAKGLAWLFMAAVLLSDSSPLTGLAKAEKAASLPTAAVNAPAAGAGRVPTPATGGAPAGALDSGANTARATNTPRRG
jgi:hypothetical protein